MAFVTRKKEEFRYNTPQEMYQDNKFKKIMGPLDYQSSMLDSYQENANKKNKKNIALELPTGSGKTLVGLLIGEFRRRKFKEKVLYLCPTNQLVHQVAEQASTKFGLNAIPFCGRQKLYENVEVTKFLRAESIGVTTYSSFFAYNSIFNDVDVVIMDDVHSCEEFIIANWSLYFNAKDQEFKLISEWLKPYLEVLDANWTSDDERNGSFSTWYDMVPTPLVYDHLAELKAILKQNISNGTSNYYAFQRLLENLEECNIFVSQNEILIRPWVAPTMSFPPFSKVKQRILMSATLGKSGELERITGVDNIVRLPIVNDWDKKGLGRRFFTFPDLSLENNEIKNVIISLQEKCKRSVFLVPDMHTSNCLKDFYTRNLPNVKIFEATDIEESKEAFITEENATVILANRFDGVDFSDESSRLLFIINLPRTTNLQEKFLISRMGASKLYSERIRSVC